MYKIKFVNVDLGVDLVVALGVDLGVASDGTS